MFSKAQRGTEIRIHPLILCYLLFLLWDSYHLKPISFNCFHQPNRLSRNNQCVCIRTHPVLNNPLPWFSVMTPILRDGDQSNGTTTQNSGGQTFFNKWNQQPTGRLMNRRFMGPHGDIGFVLVFDGRTLWGCLRSANSGEAASSVLVHICVKV